MIPDLKEKKDKLPHVIHYRPLISIRQLRGKPEGQTERRACCQNVLVYLIDRFVAQINSTTKVVYFSVFGL